MRYYFLARKFFSFSFFFFFVKIKQKWKREEIKKGKK